MTHNFEHHNNSPIEQRATDEEIKEVISLIETFPYILNEENPPQSGELAFANGAVYGEEMYIFIHQARTYRKIIYTTSLDEQPKVLLNMDDFLADYEEDSIGAPIIGLKLEDHDEDILSAPGLESDDAFVRLEHQYKRDELLEYLGGIGIALANVKANDVLTLEQADEFNQRNEYYSFFSGMARDDVILSEYGRGFPVFYGVVPRPSSELVQKIAQTLKSGEIKHGNGHEDGDAAMKILIAGVEQPN